MLGYHRQARILGAKPRYGQRNIYRNALAAFLVLPERRAAALLPVGVPKVLSRRQLADIQ
jgi:hypothetical protein